MTKLYTILCISFTLIMLSCKSSQNNEQNEFKNFVGVWKQIPDSTISIEFTEDGLYYDSRYNKQSDSLKINVRRLDGSIKEEDFGRLLYKVISREEDINLVSIYGENNGVEFRRRGYIFEEGSNSFVEIIYKMGKGIEDHIQYAVRYGKQGYKFIKPSRPNDSLVLILPYNFNKELIFIAFDQQELEADVATIEEDRKVYIADDGVNRISLKEDMRVLLDGFVSSYLTNKDGGNYPVYTLQANEWLSLKEQSKKNGIQKTSFPIPIDSLVVFSSCRFNPNRSFVNKTFGQEIIGNVLDFNYSTIRKELGYLGIE